MKNELTKLTKKQIKKIAKKAAKHKKESALEIGQRIHQEIEKKLVSYLGEGFNPEIHVSASEAEFIESRPVVLTDCSLLLEGFEPVTEQPCTICQQWGRIFRRRLPQEINPQRQPNARELREMYGEVYHKGWVSMDTGIWPELARNIYEAQLWEC